jgi:uncharacterized protein YaaN involved in tellurite resistance
MLAEPGRDGDALVLTPPEPVPVVRTERAAGLVPVEDAARAEMARRADEYVAGLAALDPRSPQFAARVGEVVSLGGAELRNSAASANRMLERTVRSLDGGQDPAQARVASSLVELRRTVEDLDPGASPGRGLRRLVSRLPGGNQLRDFVAKYASAQGTLNGIVSALRSGQDELRRDSAAVQSERVRLWEQMGKLQEFTLLADALDAAVERRIEEVAASDPQAADALRADVLFPVRQRRQDLLTQLAVCAQGYLAMDVVRRSNDELIRGVDRAATTTVSALRIGVVLAAALQTQRQVIDQTQALKKTTERLIEANAQQLSTQSGEIQRIAAEPAVGVEVLRGAFQQIFRTLDEIDTFRVRAAESMAVTVTSLQGELEGARERLERSSATGGDQR